MEKEGFRRPILGFAKRHIRIRSVTTDRHASFKRVISDLNEPLSWNIRWYYDLRHMNRSLIKAFRDACRRRAYAPLKDRIKGRQAYFKRAILSGYESGNGNDLKFYSNTFFISYRRGSFMGASKH
ncbi:hypothetical protein Aduo_005046 [Ancylostoma duodenale]